MDNGENVLVVEMRCSFAIRTAILGPREHFSKSEFFVKNSILTKLRDVAQSIKAVVAIQLESTIKEIGNFINGLG